jgi:hypothetical protein
MKKPVAANWFERVYNFLANMGLVLRDDPPKAIDMMGRLWGEAADGLALSIRELPRDDDGGVTGISVVVRNAGVQPRTLNGPLAVGYEVEGLARSAYGRQLVVATPRAAPEPVTLTAGGAIETELPIATIYEMRARGNYNLRVSCKLPGGAALRSNELSVHV